MTLRYEGTVVLKLYLIPYHITRITIRLLTCGIINISAKAQGEVAKQKQKGIHLMNYCNFTCGFLYDLNLESKIWQFDYSS